MAAILPATRSGDEVLARAIAEKAVENLDAETLNQFLQDRPELDGAVNRLWEAKRAQGDSAMMTMHLRALRPSELAGMSPSSIQSLARGAEPGAATG